MGERYEKGWDILTGMHGEVGKRVLAGLSETAPDLTRYIVEFAYGDIYAREGLAIQERQLVTLAALITLGDCQSELKTHMKAALAAGLGEGRLVEVILQTVPYIGFPRAMKAVHTLQAALEEAGGAEAGVAREGSEAVALVPIGRVKNGVDRRPAEGWHDVVSEIRLLPAMEPRLVGIQDYSHLTVLGYLDRMGTDDRMRLTVRPHRHHAGGEAPETGVLSTDAPCRPNPISVSVVELLQQSGSTLTVRGLDLFDGTPVLDVKPFAPSAVSAVRAPAWACVAPLEDRPH